MRLRTRILLYANVILIGFGATFYGPHDGFLSLRNQLGVWAFNHGIEAPARLMFEVLSGRGYAPGTGNFGAMIFQGRGDAIRDRRLATALMEEAAAQGFAPAQYNIGRALQLGRGITKDEVQARQWFERAAVQDDLFGLMMVADALETYQELGSVERIQDLLERAAAQGEVEPLYLLAWHTHLTCPDNADIDTCRAREIAYLREAADRGHVASQAELGSELSRGIDDTEGFQWSMKAAEAGHYRAMRSTARNYRDGDGVQRNQEQADYWADRYENFPREPSRFVMPRGYDAIYIYRYRRRPEHAAPRPVAESGQSSGPCHAQASTNQEAQPAAIATSESFDDRYMRELRETATSLEQGHPPMADSLDPAAVLDVHIVRVSDGRTGPLLPTTEFDDYRIYRCERDAQRSTIVLRYAADPDAVLILLSGHPVDWRMEVSGAGPKAVLLSAGWQIPLIDGLSPTVPLAVESSDFGERRIGTPNTEEEWAALEQRVREYFPNAQTHRHHHVRTTLVLVR